MSFSIEILESDAEIQKRINKALFKEMSRLIKKQSPKVQRELKSLIPGWILSQPEAISLSSDGLPGSLNAQFGLVPGQGAIAMQQVADAVAASVTVEFTGLSKNLSGGINFVAQPSNFQNLLSLSSGFTLATSLADPSTFEGELHWMDWLLTKGDSVIVAGYSYIPGRGGRSGGGTMQEGGVFRVDPSYSGTPEDNFISRAFRDKESQIASIISKYFRI